MKAYAEYKPFSYEWLPQIPKHWEERFLEQVCNEKCRKNTNNQESNVLSLSYGFIIKKKNIYSGLVASDFSTYQIVSDGDIILRFTDLQNDHKSLRTGLVTQTGIITAAYTCISPTIDSAYLHYLLHAYDLRKVFYGMGGGVRQSIGYKDVRHMFVPVPPLKEQTQIVRFLDWKVSEINKLISKRHVEIASLEELKAKIINDAVIKGLRKTPLKHNEDIRWDIDYPSTWKLKRVRELFSFRKGLSITKANLEETGIYVISYGQVHSKKNTMVGLNDDIFKYVNPSYLETNPSCLVTYGDFIFADTSEDIAGCGNCVYIDREDDIFAGYHSIIAHPIDRSNNKYFAYLFKSSAWRYQIRKKVNGVKVYSVTQQILKDAFVLLPPENEQREIVDYLDEMCNKIDVLIKKTEEKIANLHELKSTIISEVVTGKIDVRDIEIPDYEFVAEFAEDETDEDSFDEQENET